MKKILLAAIVMMVIAGFSSATPWFIEKENLASVGAVDIETTVANGEIGAIGGNPIYSQLYVSEDRNDGAAYWTQGIFAGQGNTVALSDDWMVVKTEFTAYTGDTQLLREALTPGVLLPDSDGDAKKETTSVVLMPVPPGLDPLVPFSMAISEYKESPALDGGFVNKEIDFAGLSGDWQGETLTNQPVYSYEAVAFNLKTQPVITEITINDPTTWTDKHWGYPAEPTPPTVNCFLQQPPVNIAPLDC
jgi:hypothetical protein